MKILDVYLFDRIIGQLKQDNHGEMIFAYSHDWLNDSAAVAISCSLPLRENIFRKKECQGFFGGILPEEGQRKIIARNLGISANNDFSMLEKIGGECAGALTFITSGEKINTQERKYHELTGFMLSQILKELPTRPLLAGDVGVRLSLAGVQDKVAVYIDENKISIPLDNSPSTHILKPDFSEYEGVIFNEAFCLNLAKKIDLSVVNAEIKTTENIYYLQVERYDRVHENNTNLISRLHQEDFCQAMGILSSYKYQSEGGPSLKQSFDLIRKVSSAPVVDIDKMVNAVIFNFLIGNCDAHGKNFSLLYLDGVQFAPLYDLICTVYYADLDKKMAMKLGGEYHINKIEIENFDNFSDEVGLAKPQVRRRIQELIETILNLLPSMEIQHHVQSGVSEIIKKRCEDFARHMK